MSDMPVIAVLGSGPAACDIARALAHRGEAVRIYDPDAGALAEAVARIRAVVEALLAQGRLTPDERQRTLDGIVATTDLAEATSGASLVIEAR